MKEEDITQALKRAEESTLEAIVTGVEVKSRGELFIRFRNLGGIYFPGWKHLFPSQMFGRTGETQEDYFVNIAEWEKVKKEIEQNPKLQDYRIWEKFVFWKIMQMFIPIALKDELPIKREYIDKEGKLRRESWFIKGHYTQQARWRLCNIGNCVKLDDFVEYGLKMQERIVEQTEALRNRLSEYVPETQLTRVVNDIEEIFDSYDGKNWHEIKRRLSEKKNLARLQSEAPDIIAARKEVADQIIITNQRLEGKLKLTYEPRKKDKREHELRLESDDFSYLEREWRVKESGKNAQYAGNPGIRMPSGDELLRKKWMFIDIEIPHFRRDSAQISWIGVTYVENGAEKKEIHTIHDTGESEINGYRIYRYKSEEELIKTLAERVNAENPDFVSAYNHKFDLAKLKESEAGFEIGDEDTEPLYAVTTKFFERLKIKDRLIIDPYSWAKMARAFGINKKLEMVAGFEKEIDYDEMEKLEDIALAGGSDGVKSARTIASYLTGDVTKLLGLWKLDEFRNDFKDACFLSGRFGVDLERIMHSPNCINDIQEKIFFQVLGIYRECVPPHFKTRQMQYRKTKSREEVKEKVIGQSIDFEEKQGLFRDVKKAYIPIGELFKELVSVRFPMLEDFYSYLCQHRADKKRAFFLHQFGKEFARLIMEDYGAFITDVRRFDSMLEGVNQEDFEGAYHSLRDNVLLNSRFYSEKFDDAELSTKAVKAYATDKVNEFINANRDSIKKNARKVLGQTRKMKEGESLTDYGAFTCLANARSDIKRHGWNIVGNYRVYPSSGRFFNPDKKDPRPMVIPEVLDAKFAEINDFLRQRGLEVIAQEGAYLYLRGNTDALNEENSPLVPVEDIPALFNSDHPYYAKFGYKSHMKNDNSPNFHYNLFEMRAFNEMVDNLIAGKNSEAAEIYARAMQRFDAQDVKPEELVLYNKSKGRYIAYSEGGKISFVDDPKKAPAELKEDEKGRRYFEEKIMKNKKEIGTRRVYFMPVGSVNIDLDQYIERFSGRARAILGPFAPAVRRKRREPNDERQLQLI